MSGFFRLLAFFVVICLTNALMNMDKCSQRSCHPATGNLLLGRTHRLSATSICGLHRRSRYCIVSHLEDHTKCFLCDSTQPSLSHDVGNIVSDSYELRNKNWWQSENGVQNVSIRLDLEAEFHFTHLVMTFKSFRPASMFIERSSDFGKNWTIYRYFAYDCDRTFPSVPRGPPQNHSDVICVEKYSQVAPSTGGELVYKVMSPHIRTDNPYSDEISSLIKVTNLRINFTKLHTLGDDLLDYRPEIDEKYYYAIYDLVVRGSCSCYGHASRCIPRDDDEINEHQPPEMVHGRCECTHNTRGLNCEQCEEFYNDLPWRPAFDKERNECGRCSCNGHAIRCHFDRAVYEASGFESGGVCDDCQHDTQGKNCQECKPFFYRDPGRALSDPNVCIACQCHKSGSLNDGVCEGEQDAERGLVAGKCYCKDNVDGASCDRCKNGFWQMDDDNPLGCRSCSCFLEGTFNNQGCHQVTGQCTCKRLVTGEQCDQCLSEHYGLNDRPDGCTPCDCDLGGSMNNSCDLQSGQCQCRPHFTGRRCDIPESGFFCASIDHYTYEAEQIVNSTGTSLEVREMPHPADYRSWTGLGLLRVRSGSQLVFRVADLAQSMDYNLVLRFEAVDLNGWDDVQITLVRPSNPDPDGPCGNVLPNDDFLELSFAPSARYAEMEPPVCLENDVDYEIRISFGPQKKDQSDVGANILIDSLVVVPSIESLSIFRGSTLNDFHRTEYERYQCRNLALSLSPIKDWSDTCKRYQCPLAASLLQMGLECNCDPTGSVSGICSSLGGQCECKTNVHGRRCDRCSPGTYGFEPQGCAACECDSVGALDNFCDGGQCKCRERGITGRQCNQCQPGFWGFPQCRPCECNDHARLCDQLTGACIECGHLTDGHYCERCRDGYYGDPRLGVSISCKACPCPGGPASGYQHADSCYLTPGTQSGSKDVVCNCQTGYQGERCSECSPNHWGDPDEIGGSCEQCDCNGNIDPSVLGGCDANTGECLLCLHNTEGVQCEHCIAGTFGDAKIRSCQRCVCNHLGTDLSLGDCDRVDGQCPCLDNVAGQQCDRCVELHYGLASGEGCQPCDCDPNGVLRWQDKAHLQCNELDGRCHCRQDRGGRTCSDCQDYYWGDPNDQCLRCDCDSNGAATQQCHRQSGICQCLPGSGGLRCDQCQRGYTGEWPQCRPCGECFRDWDAILHQLRLDTTELIDKANNIDDTGVASVYDEDFDRMEQQLEMVWQRLSSANLTKDDIDHLKDAIDELSEELSHAKASLNAVDERITERTSGVDAAEQGVKTLKKEAQMVGELAKQLQENATELKEADVEGARNISRESAFRSTAAQRRTDRADALVARSETIRREASELLTTHGADFERQFDQNRRAMIELGERTDRLEAALPAINKDVCGAEGLPCDDICGGPGHQCGHCGGRSCLEGSVSKAEQALSFATEAADKLDKKQVEAEQLLAKLRAALMLTEKAQQRAVEAFTVAESVARQANQTRTSLSELLRRMTVFLDADHATPSEIRILALDVLNTSISLAPEQIEKLAQQIQQKLTMIRNIDDILDETRGNLSLANQLKMKADLAKIRADTIQNTTNAVKEALETAKNAQEKARMAIDEANTDIDIARKDLDTVAESTKSTEQVAMKANESLSELDTQLKAVKVEYLQISEDAKNAYEAAGKAQQQAEAAEEAKARLKHDFDKANQLRKDKTGEGGDPGIRAEKLRARAAELLHKTNTHLQHIDQENQHFDSNEVRLIEYANSLQQLNYRMDHCTRTIQERLEFFNTCD